MLKKKYDVLVAGGGVAGVCAAIASARAGAKTALIQNRPVLGGNSSSEVRVWTRGAVGGGNLYAEEMGILGELKLHNLNMNPLANPVLWDEVLLDKVLAETNIELFLNCNIFAVEMKQKNRIQSVKAYQMASEIEYLFSANMFVDATGDGLVGSMAGVAFRIGREAQSEYNESLAVKKKDEHVLGSSIFFQTKKETRPVPFVKPQYAYNLEYIEQLLQKGGGRIVNEEMNGCDYWWMEFGGLKDTIKENADIILELKKLVLGVWNYIKNSGKFNSDYLTLEWIGNIAGKRESRRFIGEYTLKQTDIENERKFSDAVCYGGWYMDFHPSGGIYADEEFCTQVPVVVYDIPLSCFYHQDFENLLFAGRNISVSHAALSSTRIMDTCGLTGQVAGETAAHCIHEDISLNDMKSQEQIVELQQKLLKNDLSAFGICNLDGLDKVQEAVVTDNGSRKIGMEPISGYLEVKKDTFLICPQQKEKKEITIKIQCKENTSIKYSVYEMDLPSRFLNGSKKTTEEKEIIKGEERLTISVERVTVGYAKIVFEANSNIEFAITNELITGFLYGYKDSAIYNTPCVEVLEEVYPCKNVVNGYNRIYRQTNLWVSQKIKQGVKPELCFQWDKQQKIKQIRCTFNPGLELELPSSITIGNNPHHGFVRRTTKAKELVKAFYIYAMKEGKEQLIAEVKDNYQRLCVVDIEETITDEIRIQFLETYGSAYAEVFEVRMY